MLTGWSCGKCGKVLEDHYTLYFHYEYHHHKGEFECIQCSYTAPYRIDVARHYDQEHLESDQTVSVTRPQRGSGGGGGSKRMVPSSPMTSFTVSKRLMSRLG